MKHGSQRCKRNIAITGLTAAGKTTHARITQAEFGLGYVSASTVLREKAGVEGELPNDFWLSPKGRALTQRIIELGVDEALQDIEDAREEVIFDCRSLPWLTRNPILSIWLESSLESRVWKCMVSHGRVGQRAADEIRKEIVLKDESDRKNILSTFGFDIFRDYEPMDVIIDLSSFITTPSIDASWRSIQMAQDIVSAVVGVYLTKDDFFRLRLRVLREHLGPSVFLRFSTRFTNLLDG